jgi:Fur family ferric uptake transcriptional regulator
MERSTAQRRAIRKALVDADRPLSPQEIHDAAQLEVPLLGLATVYRTLKAMIDERLLVAVELPGESARYELSGKQHHHHFHCRDCGKVYDVEGCSSDLSTMLPKGFEMQDHEIILYGLCPTCTSS